MTDAGMLQLLDHARRLSLARREATIALGKARTALRNHRTEYSFARLGEAQEVYEKLGAEVVEAWDRVTDAAVDGDWPTPTTGIPDNPIVGNGFGYFLHGIRRGVL